MLKRYSPIERQFYSPLTRSDARDWSKLTTPKEKVMLNLAGKLFFRNPLISPGFSVFDKPAKYTMTVTYFRYGPFNNRRKHVVPSAQRRQKLARRATRLAQK